MIFLLDHLCKATFPLSWFIIPFPFAEFMRGDFSVLFSQLMDVEDAFLLDHLCNATFPLILAVNYTIEQFN